MPTREKEVVIAMIGRERWLIASMLLLCFCLACPTETAARWLAALQLAPSGLTEYPPSMHPPHHSPPCTASVLPRPHLPTYIRVWHLTPT